MPIWFRELTGQQRKLFVLALWSLPVTHVALRIFGFNRFYTFVNRFGRHKNDGSSSLATKESAINSTLQSLNYATHHGLFRGNCLSQSIVLWWLLRHQGVMSDLRIGVQFRHGSFRAHAWLEHNNSPINEHETIQKDYATFQQTITPQTLGKLSLNSFNEEIR